LAGFTFLWQSLADKVSEGEEPEVLEEAISTPPPSPPFLSKIPDEGDIAFSCEGRGYGYYANTKYACQVRAASGRWAPLIHVLEGVPRVQGRGRGEQRVQ